MGGPAGVTNRRSVTHVTGLTVCFYTHRSWGPRANQLLLAYNIHTTFKTSLPNLAKASVSANTDRTLMAIKPSTPMSLKLGLSGVFHGVPLDQGESAMYDPLVSILSMLSRSEF
jgi:hypothetical protein